MARWIGSREGSMAFSFSKRITLPAVLVVALLSGGSAAAGDAGKCDRTCLSGFITQYLQALTAHDAARLPVTPDVRFTENGVAIPLGEALWQTIGGLGEYRVDYLDTQ